ncbi:MAG: hypothetical protein M1827_000243 [Pycnora praestabilis]|nr:MAG: hypothetical protein M1827_000243 [Pycnora praestabilis]
MAPSMAKKRKAGEGMTGKVSRPAKKVKKQMQYDSSASEDEGLVVAPKSNQKDFTAVNLAPLGSKAAEDSLSGEVDEFDTEEVASSASEITDASSMSGSDDEHSRSKKRKRNDPEAFATSISKILGAKLSTVKRSDPVLARSKTAAAASQELANSRLEAKAKHKLKEEKKSEFDRGRVKDVLGLDIVSTTLEGENAVSVGEILEQERRLRKTAQRGVVKLFNAVRAAQVKGEEAAREARKGTIGTSRREERVNEMSKKGFLDLIAGGGTNKATSLEEA